MDGLKWRIYNKYDKPLCWAGKAINFDTRQQAQRFLESYAKADNIDLDIFCAAIGIIIKKDILFYDGGHIDLSGKVVIPKDNDFDLMEDTECYSEEV